MNSGNIYFGKYVPNFIVEFIDMDLTKQLYFTLRTIRSYKLYKSKMCILDTTDLILRKQF